MTFDQWLQTEAHPHLRDAGPLGTEWIRQIYEAGQRNALPAPAEQGGESAQPTQGMVDAGVRAWHEARSKLLDEIVADVWNAMAAVAPVVPDGWRDVVKDLLVLGTTTRSCQSGVVSLCRCWTCVSQRATDMLAAAPEVKP